MRYGFTGSSTITYPYQRQAFVEWVKGQARDIDGFDHGDCVMADEFAHAVIRQHTDAKVTLHPPTNESKRAFCMADHEWLPKPYLARNKDVVDATDTLLAMPHGEEELRSGTLVHHSLRPEAQQARHHLLAGWAGHLIPSRS